MNLSSINNLNTPLKGEKQSKVLDVLNKKKEREKIDVDVNNLKDFVINNRFKVGVYKFTYTDRNGEVQTNDKRLFSNGGYICYFKKGSSRGGYILDFSQYKDLKITAIMKNLINSNLSKEELIKLNTWKDISKFRELKFHKNLEGTRFYDACKNLPKTYDEWVSDQEGKVFPDREYKGLYDYKVTSGCALDGKVIGEKRLKSIFGENVINRLKEALENKENFSAFGRDNYDYTLDLRKYGDTGNMTLTLSEEYKDCGNGHYYVGTDYNNFIYVEKD